MRPLVDFMNHGILPFTGRGEDVERVVSFWRGSSEGYGLRGMLVLGEAGVGKSRLLEEGVGAIARANGAVVRVRLFPESATSIVPLIARGLWRFAESHPQLAIEAEETPASVVAALRRLIHLRRTLLVFEDIHLLGQGGGGISTFGSILESLADEQVALLCLARPVELPVKGILERHLVEEITLGHLGAQAIASIWESLFGSPPSLEILHVLAETTGGNPLAIRSALRGAIKAGGVVDDGNGVWRVAIDARAFHDVMKRSVELLSEGMAAHLDDDERRGASRVAVLGEVVAREAALAALDGDSHLLSVLAFKGVLIEGGLLVESLPGPSSVGSLLSFTHSLLHRRLAGAGATSCQELAELLSRNLPLYSVVPFHLLLEGEDLSGASVDVVRRVVRRGAELCPFLNRSNDWELGEIVRRACSRLVEANADAFHPDELLRLRVILLNAHLFLLWRSDYDDEYARLVQELERLSLSGDDPVLVEHRLLTQLHRMRLLRRRDYSACGPVWEDACRLVAEHPFLIGTMSWIQFLAEVATSARTISDVERMRQVEGRYREIIASDIPADIRHGARHAIFPYIADLFDTPQEAVERLATIDDMMAERRRDDRLFAMKALLRHSMGWFDEAATVIRTELIPRFRASGLLYNIHQSQIVLLQIDSAHGRPLDDLLHEGRRILDEAPAGMRLLLRQTLGVHLPYEGLLRGDKVWADETCREFLEGGVGGEALRFLIDLARGDRASALARAVFSHARAASLQRLVGDIEEGASPESIASAARSLLAEPQLRTSDLAILRALFDILLPLADRTLREELRDRLERALEWLVERSLGVYMMSILEAYGELLPAPALARWRGEGARIARGRERHDGLRRGAGTIRVSMLGSLAVRRADGETTTPRGIRVKTLLGLMIADRMLETPLSHREFCRLVAPESSEFEDARKTLNLAVHRLRESIGHEAILTDRETPRLDPELVDVDLEKAHRLLEKSLRGVREGSYPRAFAGLLEALDLVGGSVSFPTLYDDFFEAVRDDFESRLRSLVLSVARGLVREGDAAGAALVLEKGIVAMPGDEEIGGALADAFTLLGRRTQAERIRMEVEG